MANMLRSKDNFWELVLSSRMGSGNQTGVVRLAGMQPYLQSRLTDPPSHLPSRSVTFRSCCPWQGRRHRRGPHPSLPAAELTDCRNQLSTSFLRNMVVERFLSDNPVLGLTRKDMLCRSSQPDILHIRDLHYDP